MSSPSRTLWPDWAPRPVTCCECGQRVTLKQAHRTHMDEQTGQGRVWHTACDRYRVRVIVEKKAAA